MIFGLCGRKRSGKDTCASILVESLKPFYDDVICIAFADAIKDQLSYIFNVDISYFHDQSVKEVPLEQYPYRTPRNLMLWYGTMMKQEFGANIWVQHTKKRIGTIDPRKAYIFTDVRFVHEANFIKQMGGSLVYIDRDKVLPEMPMDAHESERSVYYLRDNFTMRKVDNNHTLEYLKLHLPYICGVYHHRNNDTPVREYGAILKIQNLWKMYQRKKYTTSKKLPTGTYGPFELQDEVCAAIHGAPSSYK